MFRSVSPARRFLLPLLALVAAAGCKSEDQAAASGGEPATSKPELNAVRLEVTELESGELPGGGYVAHRVAIPDGVKGPYFAGVRATCSRYRAGDDFYIVTQVRIPESAENDLWPLLLDACKNAKVEG